MWILLRLDRALTDSDDVPQRLKPQFISRAYGTVEIVP